MSEQKKMEQENMPVEPIEHMIDRLGVTSVFGPPQKEGNVTIIPVAKVNVGFGYGFGRGTAPATMGREMEPKGPQGGPTPEGSGGGGGAGGGSTPVGYIEITPESVSFRPIVDETRLGIAGIAMGAWSVYWTFRTLGALIRLLTKKR